MKYVEKGVEPIALTNRRAELLSTPGVGGDLYSDLGSEVRQAVLDQAVEEQGYACAYTGIRIDMEKSHVEHMYPRSESTREETIDYKNMVACYPGPKDDHPGFGALEKDNWPKQEERHLFVLPTNETCERRFQYTVTGEVKAADATDAAVVETIKKLKLNHDNLKTWRAAQIGPLQKLKRSKDLRKRLSSLCAQTGRIEEYSFPKISFLQRRLAHLEARRRGMS